MAVIKKIGVLSLAKFEAILMAVMGLIEGLIFAFLGMFLGALTSSMGAAAGLGFFGIIVLPIVFGIMGFVFGAIGALLYNLIARLIGGIEIELQN